MRKLGLTIVAVVGGWIVLALVYGGMLASRVPVNLPGFQFQTLNDNNDGFLSARGTWVIEGEASAFPLQTSKIWCWRPSMTCDLATAEIVTFGQHILNVEHARHEVTQWTATGVTFESDSLCVRYTYSIVFATKSVTGIRILKKDAPSMCAGVTPEFRIRLTDGASVTESLRASTVPWLKRLVLFWQ